MLADLSIAASHLSHLTQPSPTTTDLEQLACLPCQIPRGVQQVPIQFLHQLRITKPSMTPSFCFTITEMRPHADSEDILDFQGVWHPPQAQGSNVALGETRAFNCDGDTMAPMPLSEVPSSSDANSWYGTTSAYVFQDAFHIVNYDATRYAVGGGGVEALSNLTAPSSAPVSPTQSSTSLPSSHSDSVSPVSPPQHTPQPHRRQSEPQPQTQLAARQSPPPPPPPHRASTIPSSNPTWARLRFHHFRAPHSYRSFASPYGTQIRMQTQRPDQRWARRLLPEAYWAPNKSWTHVHGRGGLVGELPLLLALVAFSVPGACLDMVMTRCFAGGEWDFGFVRDVMHGRKCD